MVGFRTRKKKNDENDNNNNNNNNNNENKGGGKGKEGVLGDDRQNDRNGVSISSASAPERGSNGVDDESKKNLVLQEQKLCTILT